jgi:hypothetical protein
MLKSYKTCCSPQTRRRDDTLTQPNESSIPSFQIIKIVPPSTTTFFTENKKQHILLVFISILRSRKKKNKATRKKKKHTIEKWTLENMKKKKDYDHPFFWLVLTIRSTEFGGFFFVIVRTWVSQGRGLSRCVLSFTFFNWALFEQAECMMKKTSWNVFVYAWRKVLTHILHSLGWKKKWPLIIFYLKQSLMNACNH